MFRISKDLFYRKILSSLPVSGTIARQFFNLLGPPGINPNLSFQHL
jgi:hypothetical protein